ncbi:Ribonuclease P protein subunit p40 [Nymphon striatum]|nr:Ribonuclease P protein subunit p40 [Nymphon striatum]
MEFAEPKQKSVFIASHFDNNNSSHINATLSHHYNHGIQIVIPNTLHLPDSLDKLFKDDNPIYYYIKNLPVHEIINKLFIECYIKKGKFICKSVGTRIDRDDCMCVTPNGHLILNLRRQTFLQLGLPAKANKAKYLKYNDRRIVDIDLTTDYCTPGTKFYKRLEWCLTERIGLNFDMLISWIPHDGKIDSSSPIVYLANKGYKGRLCQPKNHVNQIYSEQVPVIDKDNYEQSVESTSDFVSSYNIPEPNSSMGQILTCETYGFFDSEYINKCLSTLKNVVLTRKTIPWAAIIVHGFDDSPISWKDSNHGFSKTESHQFFSISTTDYRPKVAYVVHVMQ